MNDFMLNQPYQDLFFEILENFSKVILSSKDSLKAHLSIARSRPVEMSVEIA